LHFRLRRGPLARRSSEGACTQDASKHCSSEIPDVTRITAFPELRNLLKSHPIDPLRAFGQECRAELQALKDP
jgi:hypothetical protein